MKPKLVVIFTLLVGSTAQAEATPKTKSLSEVIQQLPDVKLSQPEADLIATTASTIGTQTDIDPTILLAQAYTESRFDPTATSRLVNGKRQVGPWDSVKPPINWSGNLYCGLGQTQASTWNQCLALREPAASFLAQAIELKVWLVRTHGDMPKALAGYGCGNAGLKSGCNGYPQRVQFLARKLRSHIAPPVG